MELNMNKKINIQTANNSQAILPVPMHKPPVPNVASPNYYGKSPYPMPYQVSSRKNDESQYCNTLGPSPRNQLLNVPYEGENCPKFKAQPFNKDSCYLMDNKRQGVLGVVCNQSGESNNSNFVRGNQFGLDYEWDLFNNVKKLDYTVEQPVQKPMILDNPSIINDNTSFYPTSNYYLSRSQNYNTYPKPNNMTENGLPTYTYPYKTLNYSSSQIENYMNYDSNKNGLNLVIILLSIFIVIMIMYFIKR